MGDIVTRIPLIQGGSKQRIELLDKIVEGDDEKITVKQLNDVIRSINHVILEIDDKLGGRDDGISSVSSGFVAHKQATKSTSVSVNSSETDLVTVSFTTTGGPVIVIAQTQIDDQSESSGPFEELGLSYRVRRDSTLISEVFEWSWTETDSFTVEIPITVLGYEDSAAAGTYTYKITGQNNLSATGMSHFPHNIFVAELSASQ